MFVSVRLLIHIVPIKMLTQRFDYINNQSNFHDGAHLNTVFLYMFRFIRQILPDALLLLLEMLHI